MDGLRLRTLLWGRSSHTGDHIVLQLIVQITLLILNMSVHRQDDQVDIGVEAEMSTWITFSVQAVFYSNTAHVQVS